MIDDILLIQDSHFKKANSILNILNNKVKLVLIYGGSGTGKSEIANCLRQRLFNEGISSFVISLDDYYNNLWHDRQKVRLHKGIKSVGLREIRWDVIKTAINNFKKRQPMTVWRINKCARQLETTIINTKPVDTLIIEGLFAGYIKKFEKKSLTVYLRGGQKETYLFRKRRMKENPDNKFRKLVLYKESKVVYQLKKYADLVINY